MDKLCKRLSQKRYRPVKEGKSEKATHACVLGIDQSSFDFSETIGGLLEVELSIISKIVDIVDPDHKKEWEEEMLRERQEFDVTGKFRVGDNHTMFTVLITTLRTRASGDRGTSVLNWIVEFLSTISCIFAHPEDIVRDMAKRVLNAAWYRTNFCDFVDGDEKSIWSFFDGSFEGDDGLVQLIKSLLNFIPQIEDNFHKLGLNCTLEPSNSKGDSVVEFVGTHILVGFDGRTAYGDSYGGVFCPVINKALCKSSWTLAVGPLANIATSSYQSRFLQFRGKQDWIADYFHTMAKSWGGDYLVKYVDQYAGHERGTYNPLPNWAQNKLMCLSTGCTDARGWVTYEHKHKHTTHAGDLIYDFPKGFQNFIRALSVCDGATQINNGQGKK